MILDIGVWFVLLIVALRLAMESVQHPGDCSTRNGQHDIP